MSPEPRMYDLTNSLRGDTELLIRPELRQVHHRPPT
jgi:hypothetical protein